MRACARVRFSAYLNVCVRLSERVRVIYAYSVCDHICVSVCACVIKHVHMTE